MDLAGVDADMLKSLFECIDKNDRKEVEEFLAENVEFPALEATAQFPPTARVMEKSGKTVLDRIREEEAKGKSRKSKTEFPAPPITERTKGGITPLFYAVAKGSVESVRGLLSFGARRSGPSIQGITPLMLAAMNGQAEIIRVLLFETPTRLPQDVAEVTEIAVRSASTLEVEDVTKEEEEGSIENDKDEVRDVDGERNRKKDRPASPGVSSKGSAVVIAVGKIEPLVSIDAVDDEVRV
uniref:Uncharacterized protein n=1 Tax=Palpitomonas bilix TaxID=652834 RepID=A0A7S3DAF6_9EUKA|mmetsp:Transcript_26818/g.68934  ORF Transcript_26818/g.68934 Transcript_26818/m.68934 type:complete len:239 (+) Transcript_26818:680-1396(+)